MSVTTTSIPKSRPEINEIYNSILQDKCVLVLGPNFYADTEGTHQVRLLNFFKEKKVAYKHYYEKDELFLFEEDFQRTKACGQIRQFYEPIQPSEQLHKIAAIPFHFYMTVTPDKLLHKAYKELTNQEPQTAHYKKDTEPQNINEPTKNNPLIYNTFGILDNKESIILTYDDLYNYFKCIFSREIIPKELIIKLDEAEHIVFLGVPFQKWYMHLLLRVFGAHENKGIIRYAADDEPSEDIRKFCKQQFKIHFIDDDIMEFVNELYDKFKEKDTLRVRPVLTDHQKIEVMKDLIRDTKIKEVIAMIRDYGSGAIFEDEIIGLESRYKDYESRFLRGELAEEFRRTEIAQIRSAILALVNRL